jgi:N-acetylglutamate synthase-like GNAT family acetyltransferase
VDTVRLANATDACAITQLQLSNWQLTHTELAQSLVPKDVESAWTQAITIQGDIGRVLVCERDGVLVGFAAIEFSGEVGLVSLLEVAPDVRRQLIGARLLNAVADIALQAGCRHMSLWLNTEQSGGQEFFESMGWALSGATRIVSTGTKTPDSDLTEFTEEEYELTTSLVM